MDLKSKQMTSEDADFSCYICRASHFKIETGLYQHFRDKHGKTINYMYHPSQPEEQYTCEICFNVFNTLPELKKHRHTKHWKCQDCGRLFLTKKGLTIHSSTHGVLDVKCPGCEAMFLRDSSMVLHLASGNCSSGADQAWVTKTALESPDAEQFTSNDDQAMFKCPGCNRRYCFMACLLQYVECEHCDVNGEWQPLKEFLRYAEEAMAELQGKAEVDA